MSPAHADPGLTFAGVRRGLRAGLPLAGSGFVYGLAFGTLANTTGLSLLESVLMSALVFSGTAQIAVVQIWASAPGLIPAALIVLVANIRYVLMSASLRPWLGQVPPLKAHLPLYFLVDGSYATAMRAHSAGDNDAGVLLGASLASYCGWVISTALGFLSGSLIANPKAFALDFVVVAFCASAAAMMSKTVRTWWPAVVAALVVAVVDRFWPGPWVVVAAGVTGFVVGAALFKAEPVSTGSGQT